MLTLPLMVYKGISILVEHDMKIVAPVLTEATVMILHFQYKKD